jgi:hypothetical protein
VKSGRCSKMNKEAITFWVIFFGVGIISLWNG